VSTPEQSQSNHYSPAAEVQPKKKRRIFLWFFLAVQVIFLFWIITGVASGSENTSDAEDAGTAIGVFLIVVIWFFVDFFLAVIYGVYRLATRR
jgi:hypothetical protein